MNKLKQIKKIIKSHYPTWSDDDITIKGNMRLSGRDKNTQIELLDKILNDIENLK